MQARFADPESDPDESVSLEGEPMHAVSGYYHQLDRFKQTSERLGERKVPDTELSLEVWRSPELDVDFGVLPELEAALAEHSLRRVEAVLKGLEGTEVANRTPFLGPDGIVVIPGRTWHAESLPDLIEK